MRLTIHVAIVLWLVATAHADGPASRPATTRSATPAASQPAAIARPNRLRIETFGDFTEATTTLCGVKISRPPDDAGSRPIYFRLDFTGEATFGVDFTAAPSPHVIPIDVYQVIVAVEMLDDEEAEGLETIYITVVELPPPADVAP